MVRSFRDEIVAPAELDALLDRSRRAPSAGHTQATAFVVLDTPDAVVRYWDVTLSPEARAAFRWPGLLAAPVLVVVLCEPDAYLRRYAEPDKAATGRGAGVERWPTPYWWVDAGMVVQNLLLGAVDAGLGACFFGVFDHEAAVLATFGVPSTWRTVGTVALGHPGHDDRPGRSSRRPRPPSGEVVHRGRW